MKFVKICGKHDTDPDTWINLATLVKVCAFRDRIVIKFVDGNSAAYDPPEPPKEFLKEIGVVPPPE
jgi:hypothetical protein